MINHNGKTYYPDANGWYPTTVLPPDGTESGELFLVHDGVYIEVGWWFPSSGYGSEYIDAPTHWQPLPKPPVTQENINEVPQ